MGNLSLSVEDTNGHLEYYLEHGLNPVRYEMTDLQRHFDRRGSLYRMLGLPPQMIRNARVLEVAPGSGQNSLYIANLTPRDLVLVEPNPVAQRDIKKLYSAFDLGPFQPQLMESTFQDFVTDRLFDIVICENWLGHSQAERRLLRKLGALVAPEGMLIVTAIAPVGILPNVLRKALTCRVDNPRADFSERTSILTTAFENHLATIPAMTRTCTDWVHDNVMNPAYFGILLTIPMVLDDLGSQFEIFGSSPRFARDWRWFKSLWGPDKEFNDHFLAEYRASLHNFLDYRLELGERDPGRNEALDKVVWKFIQEASALEQAVYQGRGSVPVILQSIQQLLRHIEENITDLPADLTSALAECRELFVQKNVAAEEIAGMSHFSGLFGRETLYLSLEKTK